MGKKDVVSNRPVDVPVDNLCNTPRLPVGRC
jgi:hypothetical protein